MVGHRGNGPQQVKAEGRCGLNPAQRVREVESLVLKGNKAFDRVCVWRDRKEFLVDFFFVWVGLSGCTSILLGMAWLFANHQVVPMVFGGGFVLFAVAIMFEFETENRGVGGAAVISLVVTVILSSVDYAQVAFAVSIFFAFAGGLLYMVCAAFLGPQRRRLYRLLREARLTLPRTAEASYRESAPDVYGASRKLRALESRMESVW